MLTITTCQTYPHPPACLHTLTERLAQFSIKTQFCSWQSYPKTPFLLPLCAWDYTKQVDAFVDWMETAQKAGAHFFNSVALMRWNMHKRYLCDLAEKGIHVIPSKSLPPDTNLIRQAIQEEGWEQIVLKPAIGQSGQRVVLLSKTDPIPDLNDYPHGVILQPFISAIKKEGETSLIFFDGDYSHAVQKLPVNNEWRTNSAFQAKVIAITPDQKTVDAAKKVIDILPEIPLYARIDGTTQHGMFVLNELELIEPSLYLEHDASAIDRFKNALITKITAAV